MDMHMDMPTSSPAPEHSMSGMSSTFSTNTRVTLFFAEWTTTTTATYVLTLFFLFFLGVFNRFLPALRTQLERRWKESHRSEESSVQTGREKRFAPSTVRGHVRQWSRALQPAPAVRLDDPDLEKETEPLSPAPLGAQEQQEKEDPRSMKKFWVAGAPWNIKQDAILAALEFTRAFIGYILMLAVMTYNVGFLFAVTGSVLLGELMFGRYTQGASGWQEGGCH